MNDKQVDINIVVGVYQNEIIKLTNEVLMLKAYVEQLERMIRKDEE